MPRGVFVDNRGRNFTSSGIPEFLPEFSGLREFLTTFPQAKIMADVDQKFAPRTPFQAVSTRAVCVSGGMSTSGSGSAALGGMCKVTHSARNAALGSMRTARNAGK